MILHPFDPQNWFALAVGIIGVAAGILVVVKRRQFAELMAGVQSNYGRLGRRVARENKPWVYIMVGTIAIVIGAAAILMGLLAPLDPPGTPR